MRISDWSSDVCSSDLRVGEQVGARALAQQFDHFARCRREAAHRAAHRLAQRAGDDVDAVEHALDLGRAAAGGADEAGRVAFVDVDQRVVRSEEHTSELQSLMRISYAVFCLKKKK